MLLTLAAIMVVMTITPADNGADVWLAGHNAH